MRRSYIGIVLVAWAISGVLAGCNALGGKKDSGEGKRGGVDTGFISASDWKAWVDRQGTRPPRLIVTGRVQVASAAHIPELEFESEEESNPPGVNLRLIVRRGGGVGAEVHTWKDVRYESTAHTNAGRVTILYPDGTSHKIEEIGGTE